MIWSSGFVGEKATALRRSLYENIMRRQDLVSVGLLHKREEKLCL